MCVCAPECKGNMATDTVSFVCFTFCAICLFVFIWFVFLLYFVCFLLNRTCSTGSIESQALACSIITAEHCAAVPDRGQIYVIRRRPAGEERHGHGHRLK